MGYKFNNSPFVGPYSCSTCALFERDSASGRHGACRASAPSGGPHNDRQAATLDTGYCKSFVDVAFASARRAAVDHDEADAEAQPPPDRTAVAAEGMQRLARSLRISPDDVERLAKDIVRCGLGLAALVLMLIVPLPSWADHCARLTRTEQRVTLAVELNLTWATNWAHVASDEFRSLAGQELDVAKRRSRLLISALGRRHGIHPVRYVELRYLGRPREVMPQFFVCGPVAERLR